MAEARGEAGTFGGLRAWLTYRGGPGLTEAVFQGVPMAALIMMVWTYGPGSCVWARKRRRSTWTRG